MPRRRRHRQRLADDQVDPKLTTIRAEAGMRMHDLHKHAAAYGLASCVTQVLSAPDAVSDKDASTTPLHLAASAGHDRVVGLMLRAGADPAQTDADGRIPLLLAFLNHHDRVVTRLRPVSPPLELSAIARGAAPTTLARADDDAAGLTDSDSDADGTQPATLEAP